MRKPVPSKSFIKSPVRDSRPSANSTSRPPPCRNSAIRFTAYGEAGSMGRVWRLIMIRRCNQLVSAVRREVTTLHRSSRHTQINSQSSHET